MTIKDSLLEVIETQSAICSPLRAQTVQAPACRLSSAAATLRYRTATVMSTADHLVPFSSLHLLCQLPFKDSRLSQLPSLVGLL